MESLEWVVCANMKISDKEAFRVLGLPLGVDKEAIVKQYKKLSLKLSGSRAPVDKKRLEQVVAAYGQLLPSSGRYDALKPRNDVKKKGKSGATGNNYHDSKDGSLDKDGMVLCRNGDSRTNLSQSTADLTEEEKEQRKAEKRRAKKKRRKEKKKLEKLETQLLNQNSGKRDDDTPSEEEEEEEEEDEDDEDCEEGEEGQGLDPNSAFVANAAAKRAVQVAGQGRHGERVPRHHHHPAPRPASREERMEQEGDVSPELAKARMLAKRGNEAANVGQYMAAVKLFTDAITLDQSDHRFLGNRSFCFNQLGYHENALEDAERSIAIAPDWAKGHYRRGTALRDLGRFVDAEAAFEEVLRLDDTCREAHEEIRRVMMARIVEMGFTERQADSAVAKYSNVQPALDALLSGEFKEATEDVFYSDDEEGEIMKRVKVMQGPVRDVKMNPQNPEGHTSLWVGNVLPEVTEKGLVQLFSKHAQVTSVRLLREKYCAFVNFANKAGAGRAMEVLQGYEFCGQKLRIKFPDKPLVPPHANANAAAAAAAAAAARKPLKMHSSSSSSSSSAAHLHTSKNTTTTTTTTTATTTNGTLQNGLPNNSAKIPLLDLAPSHVNGDGVLGSGSAQCRSQQLKIRGPVHGNECYFWRTTGCAFGDSCKHRHIARHQGVDRKPWQK